jgi:acyl-CoA reductase-like NAD-dependent aldehyde dehydrogenase
MTLPAETRTEIDFDNNYVSTINGRPAASTVTEPAYNRATGEQIASVPVMSRTQLDEAVAAAQAAFPGWAATPVEAVVA